MSRHEGERDPFTGQITTGHEWNGIKELNSPVPRIVFAALLLGAVFVVVWTVLMPAWPTVNGYTRGLLGVDQRRTVDDQIAMAQIERSDWETAIMSRPLQDILDDSQLANVVQEVGAPLFRDNCAACHSSGGTGQRGFPNIAEAPLMWGNSLDAVLETIRVGINSDHPETRYSQMLAFGRDGMLPRDSILALVDYVGTISATGASEHADSAQGQELFAANCASCHGEDALGVAEVGAPDLTDEFWIYGGTRSDIFETLHGGRQGHMPHWEGRLSEGQIRVLALYVTNLRSDAL
eukprot:jgi/Tetstr1/450284/TSEL_037320.t1